MTREGKIALLVLLLFGLPGVFVFPPGITWDAPGHFFRALQIARGELRAERLSPEGLGGRLPQADRDFSDALWQQYFGHHHLLGPARWAALSRECAPRRTLVPVEFSNTALYSPLNHALPALGVALARRFTDAPLAALRAGSLANLVGYLALVLLALQLMPRFRMAALLVATMPLALFQATTVSADPINLALPMLVVAWTLRARDGEAALLPLFATALLLALLKPTAIAVLPLLWLIPAARFGGGGRKLAALAAHAAAALALYWLWNAPYAGLDVARWFSHARPPVAEVRAYFFARPAALASALAAFLAGDLWVQLPHVYGGVGPWLPPGIARIILACAYPALGATALCAARRAPADRPWADALFAVSLAGTLAIAGVLLLTYGEPGGGVVMVSGRYFPVVCLTLALGLLEVWPERWQRFLPLAGRLALVLNCGSAALLLVSTAGRLR